jgi:anti-sigma regulatory factor (Ser/Thr protein kinase)
MTAELVLSLRNDPAETERVTASVTEFGARHALPDRIVSHVNLALDEAITNIVFYAYDDADDHEITVRISLAHGMLTAELVDDGRAFDPLQVAAPNLAAPLEERAVGGLGIHLIRHLIDDIQYRREGDRNHLVFTKRIA